MKKSYLNSAKSYFEKQQSKSRLLRHKLQSSKQDIVMNDYSRMELLIAATLAKKQKENTDAKTNTTVHLS